MSATRVWYFLSIKIIVLITLLYNVATRSTFITRAQKSTGPCMHLVKGFSQEKVKLSAQLCSVKWRIAKAETAEKEGIQ